MLNPESRGWAVRKEIRRQIRSDRVVHIHSESVQSIIIQCANYMTTHFGHKTLTNRISGTVYDMINLISKYIIRIQ